jgi:hypothetical protein
MSLYNTFETDKSLERDGIVLDYGFNSKNQPVQIRIARAGGANTKFAKALEYKMKPYKRAIVNDTMDNKVAEKLLIETYAESVILGWEGVEDRQGNDLEFNKENVVKVLTDLPDLFLDIQQQSQKSALFRAELREAEQGNSQRS